jgi:hypothetical protein
MIDELAQTAKPTDNNQAEATGVGPWVRPFAVDYVVAPKPNVDTTVGVSTAEWTAFAPDGHPLAEPLRAALAKAGVGDGVLLCLNEDSDAGDITNKGQMIRTRVHEVRQAGRNTMGVKLINLKPGEKLNAIAPVVSQQEEEQAEGTVSTP